MLETVRRYVEASRDALTPKKAEEIARSLVKRGQIRRDQATRLARDLVEWSRKNRDRFLGTVQREVKRQITNLGVASKDEVASLKRRVRDLERKSTARKSTGRKSTTGRTTSSKRTAKKG
jgi:polyhydroxyalkanoate synthesis regulator phasin